MSKYSEADVFKYLDGLRATGVTNMYGSPAYLRRVFGMSRDESFEWAKRWSDTFADRHPAPAQQEGNEG